MYIIVATYNRSEPVYLYWMGSDWTPWRRNAFEFNNPYEAMCKMIEKDWIGRENSKSDIICYILKVGN